MALISLIALADGDNACKEKKTVMGNIYSEQQQSVVYLSCLSHNQNRPCLSSLISRHLG
jgi:hypothetical protein